MKRLLTATLLLLLFALPGCSIGAPQVQPPAVRLADISFGEMGVFEQRLRLRLRVINPNGFALPLDGLRLALAVNDHPFAEGITNERVSIPSLGEETVELVATTSGFDVVQQSARCGRVLPWRAAMVWRSSTAARLRGK